MTLRLSLLFFLALTLNAAPDDGWRRVDEGSFNLLVPSQWKKLDVQGIESHVVAYAAPGFRCDCDEVGANAFSRESARAEIEALKKKEADPNLLKHDEHVEKPQGRYGISSVGKEARYIASGGYENLAQLFVPYEGGGFIAVRVFFRDPKDLPVALRVIRSIQWKTP